MYSKEELLNSLKKCKQKHGKVDYATLNNDSELPTGPTYDYRFDGGLQEALKEAGLSGEAKKAEERSKRSRGGYTREELINELEKIESDNGTVKSTMLGGEHPSARAYASEFGGWKKACKENNINHGKEKRLDEQEVERILKEIDKKSEKWVKYEDIKEDDRIDKNDIIRNFSSLSNAREVLSLTKPNKIPFNGHYVYVLSFTKDKEECYYVGETSKVRERIRKHVTRSSNKELRNASNITVEKIIKVKEEKVKEREREVAKEIAIEKDTNNIYGGK